MFDLSWILGHAKTDYTHHESPVKLTTKSGKQISLLELAEAEIPPCRLNPLLFNGHLQTMWTAVKDAGPPIHYKRATFQSTYEVYPGQFTVDFVVPTASPKDDSLPERTTHYSEEDFSAIGSEDSTPMLICLHGLSGGSHEVYLRQVIAPMSAAGWECCAVNARGCALSTVTGSEIFNARSTWDVRQTVNWLRKTFPNRPLYAVGFSLGANILTNYLAEEGAGCQLKAGVACSNPWNLELSHHGLMRSYIGKEVYSTVMCKNIQKLFDRHKEQILKNPKIDEKKVKSAKYLHEFDRHLQAPTWGYPTEGAYYRDATSSDAVVAIKVPFLGINATDDPISAAEAIPYGEFQQNPYTVLCTTSWGGHLSWFQLGGGRWFATAVSKFLMKMNEEVDFEASAQQAEMAKVDAGLDQKYPIFDPSHRRLILPY